MTALGIGLFSANAVSDTSKAAQIKSFRISNKPKEPLVVGSRLKLKTRITPEEGRLNNVERRTARPEKRKNKNYGCHKGNKEKNILPAHCTK